MSQLTGKVAIVTGASKGIGAGIATGLGAAGAAVVVNYAFSKEEADHVVAEITSKGGRAIAVQGNVGDAADVSRLVSVQARPEVGPGSPCRLRRTVRLRRGDGDDLFA
jgi:NAD(P)-dependent dehydrogenase (short-subunit alcohol dehydrogenase family)